MGREKEISRFPVYLLALRLADLHWHVHGYRWDNRLVLCIQPTEFDLHLRLLGSAGFAEVGGREPVL